MSKITHNQAGFTLVELIIAMAVFSFMLTIIMVGFLGVVRTHESGVVQRNTQQNARLALDQLTKAVQQSATATHSVVTTSPSEVDKLCLTSGGQNVVLEVVPHVVSSTLTVDTLTLGTIPAGPCVSATTYSRLTDDSVTVTQFKTSQLPPQNTSLGTVGVTLSVASAYGTADLDSVTHTSCNPGPGSQFCAVTTMQAMAVLKGGLE